ncbi:hypothetical protein MPSI1_002644 [Malassezia psittaci]|uniref:Smr domain-containing protein n=1 Tax=Malassezia psittaci TaxID=1821823 RepID=A0AAF0JF26_9BASI|nr:hypothetical protein MPSI1_002644 [Malassezia psittaci]
MDEIIGFVRSNRRMLLRIGRKLLKAFKQQRAQAAAGAGAGAGAGVMHGGYQAGPGYGQGPGGGQGYQTGAVGGPASNTEMVLGTGNIHAFDDNNVNAQNPQYKDLRNQARSEGDNMSRCFAQSKSAYSRGDHARAKQLSDQGNYHKQQMELLNARAVDWIYAANNADSPPGTIDVHGLYVKEALAKVDQVIAQAQAQRFPHLRIIVGKGIHSRDHVSKIRPAVEDLLRKYNVAARIDPKNHGVLIVDLFGPQGGGI